MEAISDTPRRNWKVDQLPLADQELSLDTLAKTGCRTEWIKSFLHLLPSDSYLSSPSIVILVFFLPDKNKKKKLVNIIHLKYKYLFL